MVIVFEVPPAPMPVPPMRRNPRLQLDGPIRIAKWINRDGKLEDSHDYLANTCKFELRDPDEDPRFYLVDRLPPLWNSDQKGDNWTHFYWGLDLKFRMYDEPSTLGFQPYLLVYTH